MCRKLKFISSADAGIAVCYDAWKIKLYFIVAEKRFFLLKLELILSLSDPRSSALLKIKCTPWRGKGSGQFGIFACG